MTTTTTDGTAGITTPAACNDERIFIWTVDGIDDYTTTVTGSTGYVYGFRSGQWFDRLNGVTTLAASEGTVATIGGTITTLTGTETTVEDRTVAYPCWSSLEGYSTFPIDFGRSCPTGWTTACVHETKSTLPVTDPMNPTFTSSTSTYDATDTVCCPDVRDNGYTFECGVSATFTHPLNPVYEGYSLSGSFYNFERDSYQTEGKYVGYFSTVGCVAMAPSRDDPVTAAYANAFFTDRRLYDASDATDIDVGTETETTSYSTTTLDWADPTNVVVGAEAVVIKEVQFVEKPQLPAMAAESGVPIGFGLLGGFVIGFVFFFLGWFYQRKLIMLGKARKHVQLLNKKNKEGKTPKTIATSPAESAPHAIGESSEQLSPGLPAEAAR